MKRKRKQEQRKRPLNKSGFLFTKKMEIDIYNVIMNDRKNANKVIRNVSLRYSIDDTTVRIGVSVDISEKTIDESIDINDLITKVDRAMYESKTTGKNKYTFL